MEKRTCLFICLIFAVCSLQAQKGEWTSLFTGRDLSGWKQLGGKAKYHVENNRIIGTTVFGTPNSFIVTEKEYSDFILELEVKLPDSSTNSGIQFRSHYDAAGNDGKGKVFGYQFELDGTSRGWTGGIYDESRRGWLYPIDLNSKAKKAFRQGEFNHVRIEGIGKTIKTWINNVPASFLIDETDASGFIALQVHRIANTTEAGKKVEWKNIRIKTTNLKPSRFPANIYVVGTSNNKLTDEERKNGWEMLFDGKTSNGWRGAKWKGFPDKGWKIEDGAITALSSKGKESANGGDIVTTDLYSAFDLSFDFKISTGGNSGVKYFVTLSEITSGSAIGLEYQILDNENHPDAKEGIGGNRTLSSLYDLIAAKVDDEFSHFPGKWNTGRIVVYPDNHVEHYLNGVKVLEYDRGSQHYHGLVAKSKYHNWKDFGEAKEGRILLQDHGDEASYRNIKIRRLR
ncbi:DUF1080 domain-containing protein [Agriterribacter sp.]|uniref:3-keto-disaccharide hydrolase n=1 Tax=Agriterribacter sp. TaxID=2821509 RepID=UPI002B70E1FB|nr:DUF1080 domain-containing protein [Agriterribacter sp.]HRO45886.1 DUF1080 domain-containing protein [Agriterribacter sp.]